MTALTEFMKNQHGKKTVTLFTIGYSNRPFKTVINMLLKKQIELVIDVRDSLGSYNNAFNGNTRDLAYAFDSMGIKYEHRTEFGNPYRLRGLFKRDIRGWRNKFFSMKYLDNKDRLFYQDYVTRNRICLMCAEKDFRDCHRTEIARWIRENSEIRIRVIHL